jgi:hypothetical protein
VPGGHPASDLARQRGIEDLAADVVEVDVDAVRAVRAQRLAHIVGSIIDRRVEAQLADDICALILAAGDADRAALLDLRNLPTANFGCFDAMTRPTPPARMTSPNATGAMYDLLSFIQPRIAGSSERYRILTRTSPSAGSRTDSSVQFQSVAFGMPTGRAARRNWRLTIGAGMPSL